jgi:hypothetical protein
MVYTLSETHEKMRQMSDKMGSDYFPLPVILNRIETATLDFIGERLIEVEKTQTVTDDIRNLIKPVDLFTIQDPNFPNETRYIAGLPKDYLRLVAYDVLYADGSRCRRADLIRKGEEVNALNNPNKQPTRMYPLITQEASQFHINCGTSAPAKLRLTYCKKPTYATTGQPGVRIVNLPDDAIEKILLKTVKLLFHKTDDTRQQGAYQLEETYRKTFK